MSPAQTGAPPRARKSNALLEIVVNVVVPSLILMKLSSPDRLGIVGALLVALAFPLGFGLYDLIRQRAVNWFAVLGLVSVLLTGGIGLFELGPQWLAVKEAAVPGLLGLVVLGSVATRFPLIRTLLYNPAVVNVERIHGELISRNAEASFESHLRIATMLLACTFFFSSLMNYVLAKWIVVSPAGSEAFNEELGRMTLLSYPVIAIPSMLMMIGVFVYLMRTVKSLTGLDLHDVLNGLRESDAESGGGASPGSKR